MAALDLLAQAAAVMGGRFPALARPAIETRHRRDKFFGRPSAYIGGSEQRRPQPLSLQEQVERRQGEKDERRPAAVRAVEPVLQGDDALGAPVLAKEMKGVEGYRRPGRRRAQQRRQQYALRIVLELGIG